MCNVCRGVSFAPFNLTKLAWSKAALHISNEVATTCSEQLYLTARVGSDSSNGEVYASQMGAVKIMMPGTESRKELQIAVYLSKRGACVPQVLATGTCALATVNPATAFGKQVRERHHRAELRTLHTAGRLAISKRSAGGRHLKLPIQDLCTGLPVDQVAAVFASDQCNVTVLVSELCYCDINYLVTHPSEPLRSLELFAAILVQCVDCMLELFHATVSHNDLHFGNFLIRKSQCRQCSVLVHDFGMSELNCHCYKAYIWNAEKFIDAVSATGYAGDLVDRALAIVRTPKHMDEVEGSLAELRQLFEVYAAASIDLTV